MLMTSLYEVLGVHPDDDALAVRQAFRNAVKAYHPDLHPNDPEVLVRFRRIVMANAILRDEKQRAAYDQMLGLNRLHAKVKRDRKFLRLQYQRRRTQRKMGAAAVVAVCALAGAYGFYFKPMLPAAVVAVMKDRTAAVRTASITETAIRKDSAAPSAAAAAKREDDMPAAAAAARQDGSDTRRPDSAREAESNSRGTVLPVRRDDATETPVRSGAAPVQSQVMAYAGTAAAEATDGLFSPGLAALATARGDAIALANAILPDRESLPSLPHDAHYYRELGIVAYRLGDFPRAIANLDEAIRLDPSDVQAHHIRGNAWDEIGGFENALADYDEAIRLDPNNPILFHERAIMWHRKGDLDRTLADLDRAVRFGFSDVNIYCDRGLVWYEKGSPARAVADFNHAIKLDPDFAAGYISRGLILHRSGEFNVAFADIEKTIRVSPAVFDVGRHMVPRP
jgi:tetratricopeptide (TPR) repeat protein